MRNGSVKSQVTKSQRRTARVIALMCALCLILSGCGTKKESGKDSQGGAASKSESVKLSGDVFESSRGPLDDKTSGGSASAGTSGGTSSGGAAGQGAAGSAAAQEAAGVTFQDYGMQFAPEKAGEFYNYCPSVMQTDASTRYVYYCTNRVRKNVTDYIGCRKGTLGADGNWSYGEESIVLSPTSGKWDARHVCDPSVIAGKFRYGGQTYGYMMAYLGCIEITDNGWYNPNSVGIAVANDPMGPWVKCDSINPIANFGRGDGKSWGYGQASIVSADKAGKVLLFYTIGKENAQAYVQAVRFDFSGDTPQKEFSKKVTENGLKNMNGGSDFLNNADFGYDEATNRFYVVSDAHPHPSDSDPTIIAEAFRVIWISDTDASKPGHVVGDVFRDAPSSSKWQAVASIGVNTTGKARNHNTCLVTDAYGHMLAGKDIEVMYSVSDAVAKDRLSPVDWDYLKTYRIHACKIKNAK